MENRKICFFISSVTNAGGTERVCIQIANELSRLGYSISILRLYQGAPFYSLHDDITLHSVHNKKKLSKLLIPATILRIRRILKDIAPQVVVNVDSALFVYSSAALYNLNIKNIIWEHFHYNAARNSAARVISRSLAAKRSEGIVTLTKADERAWRNQAGCKAPVFSIPNPSPRVEVKPGDALIKRQPVVLSVGRLTAQKGFDLLLDAWRQIKPEDVSGWQLHIVGSGDMKDGLRTLVKTLGLTESVKLIPATPSISDHYERASIYCLSSRYEGFPMVLLEAQAFGLPVVSFDCDTGPAEIVKHTETGLLVKNGNTAALAEALSSLMFNKDMRSVMSARARENAANYSIETVITGWRNLLAVV